MQQFCASTSVDAVSHPPSNLNSIQVIRYLAGGKVPEPHEPLSGRKPSAKKIPVTPAPLPQVERWLAFDVSYPEGRPLDVCLGSRADYGTGSGVGACVKSFLDYSDGSNVARHSGVRLGDVLVFIGSLNVFAMYHADVLELFDKLAERLRSKRGDRKENVLTFARLVNFDAARSTYTNQSMPDCMSERNRNHPDIHLPTPILGNFSELPPPITVNLHSDDEDTTIGCAFVILFQDVPISIS